MNGDISGAPLPILEYPDARLRLRSAEISVFDEELRARARRMIDRMKEAHGVGLAAIQVGWPIRMLVMECDGAPEGFAGPLALCNPELLEGFGESGIEEGCLSVPGVRERLRRFERVRAAWTTLEGERVSGVFEGLAAVCLQHELDHLNGKIFFEGLSPLKANRARERYFKFKKSKSRADG